MKTPDEIEAEMLHITGPSIARAFAAYHAIVTGQSHVGPHHEIVVGTMVAWYVDERNGEES